MEPPPPRPPSQQGPPPPASEPSEGGGSVGAPATLSSRQARTISALLGSLQHTASRGADRLGRLERVLASLATDAAEPDKVRGLWRFGV